MSLSNIEGEEIVLSTHGDCRASVALRKERLEFWYLQRLGIRRVSFDALRRPATRGDRTPETYWRFDINLRFGSCHLHCRLDPWSVVCCIPSLIEYIHRRSLPNSRSLNCKLVLQLPQLRYSYCTTPTALPAMSRLTLILAFFAATIAAQTYSKCNPLNTTTCPADAALGTTFSTTFNASQTQLDSRYFNISAGENLITFGDNGAELSISESGQSVTAQTSFYIFWGTVEVIMQAAAGTGIISTFNMLSDDLDEIDLEIMGGNTSYVSSNWYGWGNTSQYNGAYHKCDGPQLSMHNYTLAWSQGQLVWFIDGTAVRMVPYDVAGKYPQTPSFLKFGIWAGGDSTEAEGTITWAGGKTDWSKG